MLEEPARAVVLDGFEEDEPVHAAVDEVLELAHEHLAVLAKAGEDDVVVVELHLAFHLRHHAHGKMVEHVVDEQADGHALLGAQAACQVVAAVAELFDGRLDADSVARLELMPVEVARDRSRRDAGTFGDFLDGGHDDSQN